MNAASSVRTGPSRADFVPAALREYARDAVNAFRQAPLEVAIGVLTAVGFSVTMRQHADTTWARMLGATALSLPLLFGVSVLRARGVLGDAARWGASLLVLLAVGSYVVLVFDPDRQSEVMRLAALIGAAVMALSLVPAWGVAGSEERRTAFWSFNARVLARLVGVVAYAGALFAALAGAVAAVSTLFDLNTPDQLYGDVAGAVFFALVPWVMVGGIPELIAAPEAGEGLAAPRLVRLLGRYLYAPVLSVYLAILIAYAIRVLVTGEAPKNLLSPIILLAGAFGFLGSALLEPLRRDREHEGVARLMRLLPLPLLALLPFALWAVWVRRDQYGWTESRYLRFALLLALGVLAALGIARLIRRRAPLLLAIPLVLGGTLLLSAVGPWGAVAVSRGSQQARLREGLEEAGLLRGGRVTRPLAAEPAGRRDTLAVSAEAYEKIAGSLRYLYDEHDAAAVQPLFAGDVSRYPRGTALLAALRLRADCRTDERVRYVSATLPENTPLAGLPAGTLYRVRAGNPPVPRDTGMVRIRLSDSVAVMTIGDPAGQWSASADLRPVFARMVAGEGCTPGEESRSIRLSAEEARRPLLDPSGAVRGALLLTELDARAPQSDGTHGNSGLHLESLSGEVVVGAR